MSVIFGFGEPVIEKKKIDKRIKVRAVYKHLTLQELLNCDYPDESLGLLEVKYKTSSENKTYLVRYYGPILFPEDGTELTTPYYNLRMIFSPSYATVIGKLLRRHSMIKFAQEIKKQLNNTEKRSNASHSYGCIDCSFNAEKNLKLSEAKNMANYILQTASEISIDLVIFRGITLEDVKASDMPKTYDVIDEKTGKCFEDELTSKTYTKGL